MVAVYLLMGFFYEMSGEVRLNVKYGGSPLEVFLNPYTYLRAVIFSPFWPIFLYWTLYHCGNPFGCPVPK